MKEKVWTTRMLLDFIIRYGIKKSRLIKEKKSLKDEHNKIVALLKAFDLYVEEKQQVLDENNRKISESYAFNIADFYSGNFIKKRSEAEVTKLLEQLKKEKIIRLNFRMYPEDDYSYLSRVFEYLVDYRLMVQQSIKTLTFEHVTETFILYSSLNVLEQEAEKIDFAILMIIGNKEPIPEEVLINKYGFPDAGPLTGNKTIEDIIAAL